MSGFNGYRYWSFENIITMITVGFIVIKYVFDICSFSF